MAEASGAKKAVKSTVNGGQRHSFLKAVGATIIAGLVLVSTACGNGDDESTGGSTPTSARQATLAQLFSAAPGFTLTEVAQSEVNQITQDIRSDPDTSKLIADLAVRGMAKGGTQVATAVGVSINPSDASKPDTGSQFVNGASSDGATDKQNITVGGQPAVYFQDRQDQEQVIAVYKNGIGLFVISDLGGPPQAEMESAAQALLGNI